MVNGVFLFSSLLFKKSLWSRYHFGKEAVCCCNRSYNRKFSTAIPRYTKSEEEPKPISFSKSAAKNHRVDETFQYDPKRLNPTRTLVICLGLVWFVLYYGFIRDESEAGKDTFELTDMEEKFNQDLDNEERTS